MSSGYGDWETFMHDVGEDRIFRMLQYKKIFTPAEIEHKYIDQSIYTDNTYQDVTIEEWIVLEEDILLGLAYLYDYDDFENDNPTIHYHKLSDIELTYDPELDKEYRVESEDEEEDE